MNVSLKDLDVGDIFYECDCGVNLRMVVHTKPVLNDKQWTWTAKDGHGKICDYLFTVGYEFYGPKLYSEPQYINF